MVISHRPEFERRFEKAVEKALRLVGGQAERIAKETISDMEAVDTGFLRNSITFALAGDSANTPMYTDDTKGQTGEYSGEAPEDEGGKVRTVYIGTNVYYAPYVEYGTSRMAARPFLSQSISSHQRDYQELFEDAFNAFL